LPEGQRTLSFNEKEKVEITEKRALFFHRMDEKCACEKGGVQKKEVGKINRGWGGGIWTKNPCQDS